MDHFSNEYLNLNPEQKRAVDCIDGPVLVVAGPGTGKTQLLSMRVANILKQTDTIPNNILCLTFTNKASVNMRERIIRLTNGEASGVMIKTFHGFCAELMNMFPDRFWNGAKLSTAPSVIQDEILQTILTSLPLSDPLAIKFAGKYTAINDIKTSLRLVKEAGLTPEKLEAIIDVNLAYIDKIEPQVTDILSTTLSNKRLPQIQKAINQLPSQGISKNLSPLLSLDEYLKESLKFAISKDDQIQKTTNTSKWKQDILQTRDNKKGMFKERERNEWWRSLSNVYRIYREMLHTKGYYDYSDMLVEVISTLEQDPALRADVQEQFQYVLIDEFQDSNSAQMRLAHLIADHHSNFGKPLIMAVGDDDQSIYKFNGAELANMLTFKSNYPSAEIIVLTKNYRSSQAVLDASDSIIKHASDRLTLRDPSINKHLTAETTPKVNGKLEHRIYLNQDQQIYDISQQIHNTYINKSKVQSIAILARNNESLRQISAQLLALGVPISFEEQNNILDHQLVITTFQICDLLLSVQKGDVANSNYLLSQVLRHPMWNIDPVELWDLAVKNRQKDWLSALLDRNPKNKLFTIGKWLQWLEVKSSTESLRVIIEFILGLRTSKFMTSPLKQWLIENPTINSDYLKGLSALRHLLELVDDYSKFTNGTIEDFVNYLKTGYDTGQIIADESTIVNDDYFVELLTVHKAKGLEFDAVYIIDAIENNWKPKSNNRKSPANLPLQPAFDDIDDYIRLMYVATTRAKSSVTVCSYKTNRKGQDVLPTPIISGVFSEKEVAKPKTESIIQILENAIAWPSISIEDERSVLKTQLENYQLSASALIDFLDVTRGGPQYFKEQHLLRLPGSVSANMGFGTAMHNTLEFAQILVNKDAFDIQKILDYYQKNIQDQNLLSSEYNRYLVHGQDLLLKLLKSDTFWLPKGALPEQSISDVYIGDVKLYGKLDNINNSKGTIVITDYKTGQPLPSLFTKNQTLAPKAWRQRTQLIFYTLLVKLSSRYKDAEGIKSQIIYLEASSPKQLIRELSPSTEEINRLEKLVRVVWHKIMNLDFPNTDSYDNSFLGIQKFEDDLLNNNINPN